MGGVEHLEQLEQDMAQVDLPVVGLLAAQMGDPLNKESTRQAAVSSRRAPSYPRDRGSRHVEGLFVSAREAGLSCLLDTESRPVEGLAADRKADKACLLPDPA